MRFRSNALPKEFASEGVREHVPATRFTISRNRPNSQPLKVANIVHTSPMYPQPNRFPELPLSRFCPSRETELALLVPKSESHTRTALTCSSVKLNEYLVESFRKVIHAIRPETFPANATFCCVSEQGLVLDLASAPAEQNLLSANGIEPGEKLMRRTLIDILHSESRTALFSNTAPPFLLAVHDITVNEPTPFPLGYLVAVAPPSSPIEQLALLANLLATNVAFGIPRHMPDCIMTSWIPSLLSHFHIHAVLTTMDGTILFEHHPDPVSGLALSGMRSRSSRTTIAESIFSVEEDTFRFDRLTLPDLESGASIQLNLFSKISPEDEVNLRLRDVEKLRTLNSLAAGIAHDIRNPLTTARGFLQLFMKQIQSDRDMQFLHLIIDELDRIQGLLSHFMSIAKPPLPKYARTDMVPVLREVCDFLAPEATLRDVELSLEVPHEPLLAYADVAQMKQVLLNVVQNALHACQNKGRVHLSLHATYSTIVLSVVDNGCGIADISKLYRGFYTTKETGTGLGVVVSRRIVEEHQGCLDISSKPGVGTTVRIVLPRMTEDASVTVTEETSTVAK